MGELNRLSKSKALCVHSQVTRIHQDVPAYTLLNARVVLIRVPGFSGWSP